MADKTGYIGRNPNDSAVTVARQFFTASGVTTTFTFASGYLTGFLDVYVDGVKRRVADEFTATDGSTFDVLQGGVSAGSTVEAVAYKAFNAAATVGDVTGNFNVSGNTTLDGSLGVTGGTTLSNLNVTGITTLGAGTSVGFANTAFNISGTPDISVDLLSAVDINVSGAATIGGILTYEDVTNIDSVGIVTARTGVEVTANGLVVNAGVSTFAADVSIADKILHTGDTNTAIRFPTADTITAETAGTERLRITSGGDITLAGIATVFGATGIVSATAFYGDGSNLDNTGSTLSAPSSGTQRVVTTSQTSGTMTSTGTGAELAFDYANNHLEFSDNTKATFGTGNDLEIYHDGSNSYIDNTTGNLYLRGNIGGDVGGDIYLQSKSGENNIVCYDDSAVELFFDNSLKFTTKTDGVDITGEVQCDSLDVDGAADITGNVTLHANLDLQDNDKILVGTGDDLEIYHDGSDSFITHVGTGFVYLQNTTNDADVIIRSDDGSGGLASYVVCDGSTGETKLYYYGSNKLNTKTDGINVTGDVQCDSIDVDGDVNFEGANYDAQWDRSQNRLRLNDDAKLTLGSDNDFEIYHNGTNAVIDNNTGDLNITTTGSGDDIYLDAADDIYLRVAGTESGVSIIGDGAVELYHNNSKKFETTSSGVTVTGDVNSTSDINLKKDIEVVDSSTEMLNQLRGVKFTWKENDEKSVGVIAQEVEAILPELVKGEEGDKSVNYSGLVGVLIEAVKELSARVEELENK